MEKNVTLIYESVQKLVGLHRQLLDTVRQEREAIVNADLKSLQECTSTKESLIEAIRGQESKRLKATSELTLDWKRPFKELTLTNIIIAIQGIDPKGAEALRTTYNALTILIQRTIEQNKGNRDLVERSLEHVHNMKKNILGETVPRSNTYSQQGQRVNATGAQRGARLISKEA